MPVWHLRKLFEQNKSWAKKIREKQPDFFQKLANQQAPEYLWIGCADSRVPANEIIGMLPGELFVHRNVANVVVHTDLNCLSVIEYAVDVLKVKHIIVCGHYGCGGIRAALLDKRFGLVDNWLRHVRDVYHKHEARITAFKDEAARWDRLGELNVIEQVVNVCETTIVRDCWQRGQVLAVHGWIYKVNDGLLRNLHFSVTRPDDMAEAYRVAIGTDSESLS